VAGLAAIAVGSAMTVGQGEIAAATPPASLSPSSTASPEPRYPALPDANRPMTEEGLGLCRLRADIYPLGRLAVDSNSANLPQVAYNDLAAYLLTDFPDQIAAPGGGYGTTGLQIIPASADIDIQSMFDQAAARLIPELRSLVSIDQVQVGEPIGYSFEDVCRAYLDADDLAEQAVPASGLVMPFYSLALSRFDATVQLEVPHDIPAPIQELAARYPSIVRVTAVSEDYEPPRLAAGTIDEPSPERTPSR
jgi:hypothetical protein